MAKSTNKVAIITGGVAGIRYETAQLFLQEGAKVVITDVNEKVGKETLEKLRAISKDAAVEYASKGVRVNSIHPGYITTAMSDYASEKLNRTKAELDKSYPIGRMGEPKEVAKLVLFLASEDASFITGSELTIDGGVTNVM